MLTEFQVLEYVRTYLQNKRFTVNKISRETEKGDDMIAVHPKEAKEFVIEAKGETSSKKHTARFGHAFSRKQIRAHISRAFYTAACFQAKGQLGGIAVPDTDMHKVHLERIRNVLETLGIEVFLVSAEGKVNVWGHWSVWKAHGESVT